MADPDAWRANPNVGWKLHLNFDADNADHRTRVASAARDLVTRGIITTFKIGQGGGKAHGEDRKEATLYVGALDTALDAAAHLETVLADVLAPPDDVIMRHDLPLSSEGRVWGRFTALHLPPGIAAEYHQYGARGLPFLKADVLRTHTALQEWMTPEDRLTTEQAVANAAAALERDFGEYFAGPHGAVHTLIARARHVAERGLRAEFGLDPAPPVTEPQPTHWWQEAARERSAVEFDR